MNTFAPRNVSPATGIAALKIYLDTAYERGTSDFYRGTIRPALLASRHLIVIATPNAVFRPKGTDDWILREIEDFSTGPFAGNVLVARAAGAMEDPLPGDLKARFPNIEIVDLRGVGRLWFLHPTRAARISGEKLKLIAPLIDLAPEEMPVLRQEEERAQQVRLGLASGVTLAVLIAVAGLSIYALQSQWRAQAALDSSLFAVSRMVSQASSLDQSAAGEIRGNLLNQACDLIDKLSSEAIRDPRPEALITCMIERGRARERQGETENATQLVQGGIDLAEKSIAEDLSQPVAYALTDGYSVLADLYLARKDTERRHATLLKLAERAATVGDQLENSDVLARAARAAATLAGELQRAGDLDRAIDIAESAVRHLGRAVHLQADTSDPGNEEWQASILAAIGSAHAGAGRADKAEDAYRRSIEIGRNLGLTKRATVDGRLDTIASILSLARLFSLGGKGDETIALLGEAKTSLSGFAGDETLREAQLKQLGELHGAFEAMMAPQLSDGSPE